MTLFLFTAFASAQPRPASLDELRAARQQAAERPRRVIFNNDGNEPVYLCKTTSPEELLGYRVGAASILPADPGNRLRPSTRPTR